MTSVTSTQLLISEARAVYDRDQQHHASITGKKPDPQPSDQQLLANDPTLEAAIAAAEAAAEAQDNGSATGGGVGGAHGSSSNAPAGGKGGIAAVKAPQNPEDTSEKTTLIRVTA